MSHGMWVEVGCAYIYQVVQPSARSGNSAICIAVIHLVSITRPQHPEDLIEDGAIHAPELSSSGSHHGIVVT
jgi:hypothetical protein